MTRPIAPLAVPPYSSDMGMVNTVGLVLHPRRDSQTAVDTITDWSSGRKGTVLGLPEEIGRID